jgi:hypothetical protein
VGLRPTKKVVAVDPQDNRTQYVYLDGTDVTERYGV